MRSETGAILLVDDDESLRRVAEYQLTAAGHRVVAVGSGAEAITALREGTFDLLVTDILMPGMSGLELLDRVRASYPAIVPVVITAHGDVATAVRAMQTGAFDFLEKPFSKDRLLVAVEKARDYAALRDENRRLRALAAAPPAFASFVGASAVLRHFLDDLRLAADSDATVLLVGESGTGKELAARALHVASRRATRPFVVVNGAAIPESLIESELFGHRKGAFTGATEDRRGKFETADGGTIFIDEVGELPLVAQSRLLRVLQEGEVDKVGAATPTRVDIRVVTATRVDLERRMHEGTFREDLWFRLNVVPLRLPPLRERTGDVPLLLEHFLTRSAARHGRSLPRLEPEALDRLERHDWPGNIRELENLVERLIVLGRDGAVGVADLPGSVCGEGPRFGRARLEIPPDGIVLEDLERGLIEEALRRHGGNQSAAARFLGITRQTLIYRMKKFELA